MSPMCDLTPRPFDLTLSGPAQRWAFCIFARLAVKALCPFGRRTVVAPLCTLSGDNRGRAFGAFVTLVGFSGSPEASLCLPSHEKGDNGGGSGKAVPRSPAI